jgi:hypothetical protein
MARVTRLTAGTRLTWLTAQGDPALAAMLAGGIVLLDSAGNYLMDENGAVLYANDALFTTADGMAFATADGTLYGVPA